MTKYRSKAQVEAVQWDGKNKAEIDELAEDGFNVGMDENGLWAEVFDHVQQDWLVVNLRDWVVVTSGGILRVIDAKRFADNYEPVETTAANELGLYSAEVEK